MKNLAASQESKAARRSLMLGLTLAEIMLFLLFALLLLIGAKAEEQEVAASWANLLVKSIESENINITEVTLKPNIETEEALSGLFDAIEKKRAPGESLQETWTRIGTFLSTEDVDDNIALSQMVAQLTESLERQVAMSEALQGTSEEARNYADALREQLDITRGGATPPCLFKAAEIGRGLRGSSVPIGVVRIEDEQLIIISINKEQLSEPLVDFWGKNADVSELNAYLATLPVGESLDIASFRRLAGPIKAIGDVDSEQRGRCLFTADYWMDDFTPLNMFTQVFQSYFLPQQRIRPALAE